MFDDYDYGVSWGALAAQKSTVLEREAFFLENVYAARAGTTF